MKETDILHSGMNGKEEDTESRRNKMGNRIVAFLIDHVIICVLFSLLGIVEMSVKIENELLWEIYCIVALVPLCSYFIKDIINGQSIGKRIMKIKVVDTNGKKPDLFNLIIRNITILIWPVEALLLLMGKKRLGDRLAKTDVIEV